MFLPYYLECVGKAAGKDSSIEYGECAGKYIFDMGCLEYEHEEHTNSPGHKELEAGKLYAVGAGCKIAHCKNMKCKGKGTQQDIEISPLQHQLPAHAKQVEANHSQEHSSPKQLSNPMPYEKSKAWNQHNVQRSDEASLTGAGILDPHLLQVGGQAEEKAAGKAAGKKHAAILALGWQHGFVTAEERDEGNEKKTADKSPDGVECERFHIGHPYTLGDKGTAPDQGSKQKQKAAGQFFVFHINQIIKKILVCK